MSYFGINSKTLTSILFIMLIALLLFYSYKKTTFESFIQENFKKKKKGLLSKIKKIKKIIPKSITKIVSKPKAKIKPKISAATGCGILDVYNFAILETIKKSSDVDTIVTKTTEYSNALNELLENALKENLAATEAGANMAEEDMLKQVTAALNIIKIKKNNTEYTNFLTGFTKIQTSSDSSVEESSGSSVEESSESLFE